MVQLRQYWQSLANIPEPQHLGQRLTIWLRRDLAVEHIDGSPGKPVAPVVVGAPVAHTKPQNQAVRSGRHTATQSKQARWACMRRMKASKRDMDWHLCKRRDPWRFVHWLYAGVWLAGTPTRIVR